MSTKGVAGYFLDVSNSPLIVPVSVWIRAAPASTVIVSVADPTSSVISTRRHCVHSVDGRLEIRDLIVSIRIRQEGASLNVGLDFGHRDLRIGDVCPGR